MKLNPPPNWPTPADGWPTDPSWTPDPTLPEPPPGWQLWVDDDAPVAGEATEARRNHRQAVGTFWFGIALFLGGAISTIIASGANGGIIWYGGMIFGTVLLFRAFAAYRSSRKEGAPALTLLGKAATAVGVIACLAVGATAVSSLVKAESIPEGAGSCWTVGDDEEAVAVSCDDDHEYKALTEVATPDLCPEESASYLEGEDDTSVLCIVEE
ncbi:hypothetical protein [Cellulomonas sp. URHB0016]